MTPTPSPTVRSYADLGAFGTLAKKFDEQYKLKPNFADWDAVADANCDLQRKGDTEGEYVPDTMAKLPADSVQRRLGVEHPVSGRVWAASVLTRCPELLNTPPVQNQASEKVSGLSWVDPHWKDKVKP